MKRREKRGRWISIGIAVCWVLLLSLLGWAAMQWVKGMPDYYNPRRTGFTLAAQNATPSHGKGPAVVMQAMGYPHYTFVKMSAYRDSPRTFYVVGVTSVLTRVNNKPPVQKCLWQPHPNLTHPGEELTADAVVLYVSFDENGALYVPAIVNCTFANVAVRGGNLSLILTVGSSRLPTSTSLVFQEDDNNNNNTNTAIFPSSNTNNTYKYSYCGPPIHTRIDVNWILQWLVYHHYLWEGQAHFFFYIPQPSMFTPVHREVLWPFVAAGLLTLVDAPEEDKYPTWYHNQLLYNNDCLLRSRYRRVQWTFYHDFDEVLYVAPPHTLSGILEAHRDKPWVTFGSFPSQTGRCRPPANPDDWPLQRMVWRDKTPECRNRLLDPWNCPGPTGHRKYAVQPTRVFPTGVHEAAFPREGGVHLNASVANVHHFRAIFTERVKPCGILVNGKVEEDRLLNRYDLDDGIANFTSMARRFVALLFAREPL